MKKLILTILIICLAATAFAQLKAIRNKVDNGYNFWLYTPARPADQAESPLPVLIFLHGQSLTGSNLDRVRRYGVIDAIEKGRDIQAFVVAPQCPKGTSWSPERILNVLNWIQANYRTDTNRVYVTGMSLGAYGTMDFVGTYPHRVTAAAAMCGGGNPKLACNLAKVPLWVMHGTADRAVPLSESQKMVDAIAACGDTSKLIFTKYPGFDHGDLARVFYTENLYVWLLSHDKCDTAQQVVRSLSMPASSLNEVYKNLGNKSLIIEDESVKDTLATSSKNQTPPPKSPENRQYHVVKKGDTLYAIARKHNTTVAKLCQINKIKENTILQIGMKIKLR